mgnify:CR=1 FL=1
MKVLGLDISTANIGLCVIDTEKPQGHRILLAYGISLVNIEGLYTKSCEFREHIQALAKDHAIDIIAIEESLQSFRSKKSSAGTIAKLNRFNGITSYIARSELNCPASMVNSVSARKLVGCKIDRKSSLDTKEQVLRWVTTHPEMKGFKWPTKIMKSGPDKGKERLEVLCYDIADAFVVATWAADILKIDDLDATVV